LGNDTTVDIKQHKLNVMFTQSTLGSKSTYVSSTGTSVQFRAMAGNAI